MNARTQTASPTPDAAQSGYMGFANLDRLAGPAPRELDRIAESWSQLKNSAA